MESLAMVYARRMQALADHLEPSSATAPSKACLESQACSDFSSVRSSVRKDNLVCIRPAAGVEGAQYMRCCSTTHAEVREVFGNLTPVAASTRVSSPPPESNARSSRGPQLSVHAELDDDFLPTSLLYPDSWPVTSAKSSSITKLSSSNPGAPPQASRLGEGPLFARQAAAQQGVLHSKVGAVEAAETGGHGLDSPPAELVAPPPSSKVVVQPRARDFGREWIPCMDVVESTRNYVVSLELPGVTADGVRVELTDGSLLVTGTRPAEVWTNFGGITFSPNSSHGGAAVPGQGMVYHRRELAQGPYRASWELPADCDLEGVSAEFCDGVLGVVIPKKV